MKARLIFAHAITPLHAGTGQGVGIIDLPIAREKATGIPYFPGSSLKGALRDIFTDETNRTLIFGSEQTDSANDPPASLIQFTDLRLLLLPVRSLAGTFAWVTSPYLLRRLARDAQDIGLTGVPAELVMKDQQTILANNDTNLVVKDEKVYLEDLDLQCSKNDSHVLSWSDWIGSYLFTKASDQRFLQQRFAVVHDDILSFLLTTGLKITARIRLEDDKKTVVTGGLWYEEALPAESVLAGMVVASARNQQLSIDTIFDEIHKSIVKPIQLGGKATVGRGICQVKLSNGV